MKNNQSPPTFDNTLNECFKYLDNDLFISLICKLLNIVLDSGIFPDVWSHGIILPIYKSNGDRLDPNSYRGITILSCFGKLFPNALNIRLSNYLKCHNLLCEEQAEFARIIVP